MLSTILKNKPGHSWRFEAIGTHWLIETTASLDDTVKDIISKRIDEFDQIYSRFRNDSLVSKIAIKAGNYDFPTDAETLVRFYQALYKATDGSMSPLIGGALVEAGYDKNYSLRPGIVHDIAQWDDVMEWNGATLTAKQPITLDFGAAGKGYLIDFVAGILKKNGHNEYTVDASGDVRVRGDEQRIGLENPYDPTSVIGVMNVKDASICASATNRRTWGCWHHVIDAKTAKPVNDVVATWVVASSTCTADGLATALFFVDADKLREWEFQYVRLHSDGRIDHSPKFVGELFL